MDITGSVEEARASYIIRDFEKESFEARKAAMQAIADKMNQELGSDRVTLTLTDQYYNIKEILEPSVPPRIGSIIGVISRFSITALAMVTGVISFSITSFIL